MKTIVPVLMFLYTALSVNAQSNKDMPAPVANLQTLATGSYVIPMDNNLQLNASNFFNLKAYGLIVHLLNNGVKLKWSIRAGKLKDGTDFSGTALRILPTQAALPSLYNFLAGPFVIDAADTSGVAAIVQSFYTANALVGNNRPAVFQLTAPALNVDIRYNMTGFIPKAVVLNDGNKTAIHLGFMTKASIPTTNYQLASANDLVSRCFTFASEPHIEPGTMNTSYLNAVHVFTKYGGNFLAQCQAVESYENHASGRFHTTGGINYPNTAVSSADTRYPNADLAYSQFQGAFSIQQVGTVQNWILKAGSTNKSTTHSHATGNPTSPVGASVAKMNGSTQDGGLVFYLGNHDFASVSLYESINGIRMYMNALLTPTSLNRNCNIGTFLVAVLSSTIQNFSVYQNNSKAQLNWTIDKNSTINRFAIERSFDGMSFSETGTVAALTTTAEYYFTETIQSAQGSVMYYRLRIEDQQGKTGYSEIKSLRMGRTDAAGSVETYPNPVVNQLNISLPDQWMGKQISFEVIDLNGIKQLFFNGLATIPTKQLNLTGLKSGFYYVRIICNGEQLTKSIYKL